MLDHTPTRHAKIRIQQRGIRYEDLQLLIKAATRVAPDAYLMTNEDVSREISQRRSEIQRLERLRGTKVVVQGNAIVSVYPARRASQQRTLRKGRDSQ